MEWLTNMLGFSNQANQGASPFGALASKIGGMMPAQAPQGGVPPAMPSNGPLPFMGPQGQPSPHPGAPPAAPPAAQSPGLWNPQGQQNTGNNMMLGQAMNMLKPQQMASPQWMPWMQK
jgi:hypothetical protein